MSEQGNGAMGSAVYTDQQRLFTKQAVKEWSQIGDDDLTFERAFIEGIDACWHYRDTEHVRQRGEITALVVRVETLQATIRAIQESVEVESVPVAVKAFVWTVINAQNAITDADAAGIVAVAKAAVARREASRAMWASVQKELPTADVVQIFKTHEQAAREENTAVDALTPAARALLDGAP